MAIMTGRQAGFGLAKEGTRGTAETTAALYVQHTSLDAGDKTEKIVDESTLGTIVEGIGDSVSKVWSEAKVDGKMGADSFGHIALALLGGVTTTVQGAGKKHAFRLSNSAEHPSFTLFKTDKIQDYSYAGGMLDSLELSLENGNYANFSASFKAKKGNKVSVSPAFTQETSFLPKHARVKIVNSVGELAGSTGFCVTQANLSFSKNLIEEQCLGSVETNGFYNTLSAVEGSFECYYKNTEIHDDLLSDKQKVINISLENTDVDLGGGLHPKIDIVIPNAKYQDDPIKYDNGNIVTLSVSFKGYLDMNTGDFVNIDIINNVTNY